jgi:hypothetical protein
MLGPKKKKGPAAKKPKKSKKAEAVQASRVSARLKGEVPEVAVRGAGGGAGGPAVFRVFQERGLMEHSFRNIVQGEAESYPAAVAARLVAQAPPEPPALPDGSEPLSPDATPCSHCRLRRVDGWLSACSNCNSPRGRVCAPCLWRRYGEAAPLPGDWQCPECRGLSNAGPARERRGWGALGDSCFFDARAAGFLSVAHWIVLRRTETVLDADIQEAIPNRGKRGRPLGGGGEIAKRVKR